MLDELVFKNRSYRGYDGTYKVSREDLVAMVECARLTPSSVNKQPLKYKLIYEEEDVAALQPKVFWARALPQMTLPHEGHAPTAFIVICQDMNLGPDKARYQKDVGIVAQTMLLKAVELGLGGCMIGNFNPGQVQETVGLPEDLYPMLVVAVGKPDEEIVLVDVPEDGNTNYYRDENDVHYVPKRSLEDILIG